ncbi:hypothetical protein PM082_021980 [Marasmius tenuissimus]|nr:hypothetical protein PM082_021980 [Marasmius tenuissimus]
MVVPSRSRKPNFLSWCSFPRSPVLIGGGESALHGGQRIAGRFGEQRNRRLWTWLEAGGGFRVAIPLVASGQTVGGSPAFDRLPPASLPDPRLLVRLPSFGWMVAWTDLSLRE